MDCSVGEWTGLEGVAVDDGMFGMEDCVGIGACACVEGKGLGGAWMTGEDFFSESFASTVEESLR